MSERKNLRFGILSCASILEYGFMPAVELTAGVEAAAVASRDRSRAGQTAQKYGIEKVCDDYASLLADPDIDCVYIPLPNALHVEWARRALEAGKHVLCEKPLAWSAAEARTLIAPIADSGLTFAEAFQYRYHPLIRRIKELIRSGSIGEVRRIEASYCEEIPDRGAVQFRPGLAGGALMDVGCYCVNFCRYAAGCDDAVVVDAKSDMANGVDGATRAQLRFDNGVEATIICSILETTPCYAVVAGSEGTIFIYDPFPASARVDGRIVDRYLCILRHGDLIEDIRVPTEFPYACQLEAFRDAVHSGAQPQVDIHDAVANMEIIDAVLSKAGVGLPYPDGLAP